MSDVGEAGTRLINILNQAGHGVEEIITAGTPSLTSALKFIESVHDEDNVKRVVSPGTVVLHDLTSESSNAELDLEPACVVLARVVSHPCEDIFTVDAGSKAMAAEAGHPMAYVLKSLHSTTTTQNVTPLTGTVSGIPICFRSYRLRNTYRFRSHRERHYPSVARKCI